MSRMMWIAASLAAGLAAVVLVVWFAPSDDSSTQDSAATTAAGEAEPTGEVEPTEAEPTEAEPTGEAEVDDALAAQGEQTASAQGCTACHSVDGSDGIGPTWSGIYGTEIELEGGEVVVVDAAYLEEATLDPGARVRAGFGASMPSFEGKVSEEELAALVEYIKSLGG